MCIGSNQTEVLRSVENSADLDLLSTTEAYSFNRSKFHQKKPIKFFLNAAPYQVFFGPDVMLQKFLPAIAGPQNSTNEWTAESHW